MTMVMQALADNYQSALPQYQAHLLQILLLLMTQLLEVLFTLILLSQITFQVLIKSLQLLRQHWQQIIKPHLSQAKPPPAP